MPEAEPILTRGCYRARVAQSEEDLRAAQRLRGLCFATNAPDRDRFDAFCVHVLIEDLEAGTLVACFRLLMLGGGHELGRSYSAQFYELAALRGYSDRLAELGRFCSHPERSDPDILRVAWGAITRIVDQNRVGMLFGCSSFAGTDTDEYLDVFALLKQRHLAPECWLPQVKVPNVFRFGAQLRHKPDVKQAMLRMPPLLKTYLAMGGWVSDHAVVDTRMNTLHVFTGVEIGAIPAARKRLLRAVAG